MQILFLKGSSKCFISLLADERTNHYHRFQALRKSIQCLRADQENWSDIKYPITIRFRDGQCMSDCRAAHVHVLLGLCGYASLEAFTGQTKVLFTLLERTLSCARLSLLSLHLSNPRLPPQHPQHPSICLSALFSESKVKKVVQMSPIISKHPSRLCWSFCCFHAVVLNAHCSHYYLFMMTCCDKADFPGHYVWSPSPSQSNSIN